MTTKSSILQAVKTKPLNSDLITAGNRKNWGFETDKIYINEHLTKDNTAIFYEARKLKKNGFVKYAWVKNGTVKVKKEDGGKAIIIQSLEFMESIKKQHGDKRFLSSTNN